MWKRRGKSDLGLCREIVIRGVKEIDFIYWQGTGHNHKERATHEEGICKLSIYSPVLQVYTCQNQALKVHELKLKNAN